MRSLTFAGHTWEVRNSVEKTNPGPNYFSDEVGSVSVDTDGLHLAIEERNKRWECSEVILTSQLGYGKYIYTVESSLLDITGSTVFGAFLYENDRQEVDIEISPQMVGEGLVQFAIQPTWKFWRVKKVSLTSSRSTTHTIEWYPNKIVFTISDARNKEVLASWSKRGGISSPNTARFMFNLWLFNGVPPTQEQVVTISSFSFTAHK